MSIELHIFMPESVAVTARAWQQAISAAGFPTALDAGIDPEAHSGFLPATYNGKSTGFEFHLDRASEVLVAYPHIADRVGARAKCATFRWGGNFSEMCAALSAAAALARLADGLYFYPDGDVVYEAEEALLATRRDLKAVRA